MVVIVAIIRHQFRGTKPSSNEPTLYTYILDNAYIYIYVYAICVYIYVYIYRSIHMCSRPSFSPRKPIH